ncbi:MAG: PAS domain-containing sensor histidine kinase [Daejeonella sp.]
MSDPDQIDDPFYNFEHFFELSPDLLCIASFEGYFKRINPAVSKLLGYSDEELRSRPISEFVYEEDREMTRISRESILRMSTPLVNFENRYQTKTGGIVWLSWTSMPVEKEQLIYAVAKNISSEKKIEAVRNEHLANLTKINKDLKQLSYTTSHDLRSPVNNLISLFSLLDASMIKDEETLKTIELLKTSAENLSEVLNHSVDALIQKDKLQIKIEELDLLETLNTVLLSINSIIRNSKATVNTDFSVFDKINFNRAYLESIYLNLITNSLKYARPGLAPIITISARITNGIKQLTIADNGMGIDLEKVQDKIFGLNQKFHDHIDSKGIGLYLVYNHITNLNGRIDIKSKVNEGTEFIISFKTKEAGL